MAGPARLAKSIGNSPLIDGEFKVLSKGSQTPSDSRALVPVSQPADSRLDAALRQHARAKPLALRSSQGRAMAGQIATTWDHMFVADPTGDQTLNALALAEVEASRRQLARERAEAARAVAVRAREPTQAEMWAALGMGAINLWGKMQDDARQRKWEEWKTAQTQRAGPSREHVGEEDER